jgi:hypothetical protein
MISVLWLFIGSIVGLLVVSIFNPPMRDLPKVPVPGEENFFNTKTGCIKLITTEVPCTNKATSLNFVAAQHK